MPVGVIAEQRGHADNRITEQHYAHLDPSYIADTIRSHFRTLGIAGARGIKEAMKQLWPDRILKGLSAKDRNNVIDQLTGNGNSVPKDSESAIQRLLKVQRPK
jgi:hypothetical protein